MKILLYKAGDVESHKELGKKLQALDPGEYCLVIKRNRPIRSLNQNKYYHVILNIIAIETGHTHDELHEICKMKFNEKWVDLPGGAQMIGRSTSELDSAEFTGYLNRVKQWALDGFNISIPEPRDIDYARWIEIENTYDDNFKG